MKAKLLTAVVVIAMIAAMAGCDSASGKAPDSQTDTSVPNVSATGAEQPTVDNPLEPIGTESWTDGDWDSWVEDGYDDTEWDTDVFADNQTDLDDSDVWNDEEWADESWADESLSAVTAIPQELPLTTLETVPNKVEGLLTNLSVSTPATAESLFLAEHPSATVLAVRPQGRLTAVFGLEGNTKYKMVVSESTGEIVLDKVITMGQAAATSTGTGGSSQAGSGGAVDQKGAEAVFTAKYPEATLLKSQLEDGGNAYYLYGRSDSAQYQMKVLTDGTVVLDRVTQMGPSWTGSPTGQQTPAATSEESQVESPDETPAGESVEQSPQGDMTTGPVDEAGASAIFASYYPGATLLKVQLQDGGSSVYLYGQEGNSRYKMKVLTADGRVVMNQSNNSGRGNYQNYNQNDSPETSQGTAPAASVATGGTIDEAGAIAIFNSYYPGVAPTKVELQDGGAKYYLYAQVGGTHYKMNVRVSDGTVLYSNAGGGGGGYNNSTQGQAVSSGATADGYSGATADGSSGATQKGNRGGNYGGRRG